jgi:hypothetical protein
MSRSHKVLIWIATGATIGGGTASLIAVAMTLSEPRFIIDAVMVLGIGGAIGGAICGMIVGLVNDTKAGAVIGGMIGGLGGCVLAMAVTFVYVEIPWPSPKPYPGVEMRIEYGGGSWGVSQSQVYTATLPLNDMQHYYDSQMKRYCKDTWQFETRTDYPEYSLCRLAECEIRRLWLEQYFRVSLCSTSETETLVTHIDIWQD